MRAHGSLAIILLIVSLGSPLFSAAAQSEQIIGNRKVLSKVMPEYPRLARDLNIHGTVRLEVSVGENGSVKSIQVKGGSPVLAQSAQTAVRAWRWEKSDHESTERVELNFN
jgi:TonB family protein